MVNNQQFFDIVIGVIAQAFLPPAIDPVEMGKQIQQLPQAKSNAPQKMKTLAFGEFLPGEGCIRAFHRVGRKEVTLAHCVESAKRAGLPVLYHTNTRKINVAVPPGAPFAAIQGEDGKVYYILLKGSRKKK